MVEKTVTEKYKEDVANKYTLGMAINNAAVISANKDYNPADMELLIKALFELYKKIRQEILGY